MRLLSHENGELYLTEHNSYDHPPYAVLSHRWFDDQDEVTYKDMSEGLGKDKAGQQKIRFCEERIAVDNISNFWIDACCIDKTNSAELSEAINSMFRWYQDSAKCYVYMSDVSICASEQVQDKGYPRSAWEPAFRKSTWFTRGWTLQELIAPPVVEFFSSEGYLLGDKASLEVLLHEITKIPIKALRGDPLSDFSVEERMSWAAHRHTKREEDKAYSLFGIFDVYLPLIYGEGQRHSMRRLRREIADLETPITKVARVEVPKAMTLHNAAKGGITRLVEEYLQPGGNSSEVNVLDDQGRTALHYAKNSKIAQLLIDAGALIDYKDDEGQTPLHKAVIERRLLVVKKLLSKAARLTDADHSGKTTIDYADGCPAAMWMLQHGCRSDGLHHMAWLGDLEGVQFFLSQGSEINQRNRLGETALTEASRHGDTEVVVSLLQLGADIELRNRKGGYTPLILATMNNRGHTVDALISAGASLKATGKQNQNALIEAVFKGHWDIATILIGYGADVNIAEHGGNTPLHCSGHRGPATFTQYLVRRGAKVDAQNTFGGTAMLEAIEHCSNEATQHVEILLEHEADATIPNYGGYTPLSMAARVGNEEVVKLLLNVVPDPSLAVDPNGIGACSWTPLAEACFNCNVGCVRLLLDVNFDTESKDNDGFTALHQAVRTRESDAEIVRLLVSHGALLEAQHKDNLTPLELAAKYSNREVVEVLLQSGSNMKTRSYSDISLESGYSPLLFAIEAGNEEAVRVLIHGGVDLEVQTTDLKLTALMMAAKRRKWDLVTVLLDRGANVNACDVQKTTPLMEAAKAGNLAAIRELINHGADRRLRDTKGRTAWVWAKHEGRGSDFEILTDMIEERNRRKD